MSNLNWNNANGIIFTTYLGNEFKLGEHDKYMIHKKLTILYTGKLIYMFPHRLIKTIDCRNRIGV